MYRGEEAIALLQCNYINSNYANCRRANDCSREGGNCSPPIKQTRLSARYKTDNSIALIANPLTIPRAEYHKFRSLKIVETTGSCVGLRREMSEKLRATFGRRQQVTDRGRRRGEFREKKGKMRERRKKWDGRGSVVRSLGNLSHPFFLSLFFSHKRLVLRLFSPFLPPLLSLSFTLSFSALAEL